jgi:hypothetical protein
MWPQGLPRTRTRLRQGWRVHMMCHCPAPGGEPLWHVFRRLATFALSLVPLQDVRTSGSRERPQRYAFTRGLDSFTPGL